MSSYVLLLLLAYAVNIGDRKMLLLATVVGVDVLAPIPAPYFYLTCGLVDALVGLLAYQIAAAASRPVWRIALLLVAFHVLGYVYDGYPPESPYHLAVKICEHAQLIACILLSHHFTQRRRYGF